MGTQFYLFQFIKRMRQSTAHIRTQLVESFQTIYNIAINVDEIEFVEVIEVVKMGILKNEFHYRVQRTRLPRL